MSVLHADNSSAQHHTKWLLCKWDLDAVAVQHLQQALVYGPSEDPGAALSVVADDSLSGYAARIGCADFHAAACRYIRDAIVDLYVAFVEGGASAAQQQATRAAYSRSFEINTAGPCQQQIESECGAMTALNCGALAVGADMPTLTGDDARWAVISAIRAGRIQRNFTSDGRGAPAPKRAKTIRVVDVSANGQPLGPVNDMSVRVRALAGQKRRRTGREDEEARLQDVLAASTRDYE